MLGNKRLFVILIGLVMFIGLMGFTIGPRTTLTWPEKFVRDTVGFVQNIFYKPAGYIAGLFEDVGNMREIYDENERLKIALAQYAREKTHFNILETENEQLKEDLKFTTAQSTKNNYEFNITQVVSVNSDPNNRSLVIDIGSREGVKLNMFVTSVKGLVGVISQVSNFSSTVKLITTMDANDPNINSIAVTALDNKNKTFGIIESYNEETKKLLMTSIKADDPLKKDDTIVSSGSGGLYPKGIVIGTVDSVQEGSMGLLRTATITPSASFVDWKQLFVVFTPEVEE
ncbi:rod shape-determining protein MreC [Paenibacillus sp. DS2015]|uniref:rod shape-determining protein MreC n=1 Tax=Paenibacillus sp. DS2015 TaxID=3373917 RepID=UPI003D263DAC